MIIDNCDTVVSQTQTVKNITLQLIVYHNMLNEIHVNSYIMIDRLDSQYLVSELNFVFDSIFVCSVVMKLCVYAYACECHPAKN